MNYKSNFQPVLDVRNMISSGVTLSVAHVRTILNVMRADTSVQLQYTPPEGKIIQFPKRNPFAHDDEPYMQLAEAVERTRHRLQDFEVRGSIKPCYTFGMSPHKTSLNIHYVSRKRSQFCYKQAGTRSYSRGRGWQTIWENRIEVKLMWDCGQEVKGVRLLTTNEASRLIQEGVMKLCPNCILVRTRNA
jgi:hypothetical protein